MVVNADVCTSSDLLKRHVASHNNPNGRSSSPKPFAKSLNRQSRVNKACEACAELHLKCDNEKPCARCRTKNIYCQYGTTRSSEAEAVAQNLLSLSQQPPFDVTSQPGQDQPPSLPQHVQHKPPPLFPQRTPTPSIDHGIAQTPTQGPLLYQAPGPDGHTPTPTPLMTHDEPRVRFAEALENVHVPPIMTSNHDYTFPSTLDTFDQQPMGWPEIVDPSPGYGEASGSDLRDFLMDVMGHDSMNMPPGITRNGNWTPRNFFDLGTDASIELNDMDLTFLDDYNHHNPFATSPDAFAAGSTSVVSDAPSDPPLGVETLQKASTWRFRPVSKDNLPNHMAMPATITNQRLGMGKRVTPEVLPYTVRDQILATIIAVGPDTKSMLSFPSVDLLDSLLQYHLSIAATSGSLIHAPTFKPSQKRPELVAAMIAAGAAKAPDASLRKLGLAIQEAVRMAIPRLVGPIILMHIKVV